MELDLDAVQDYLVDFEIRLRAAILHEALALVCAETATYEQVDEIVRSSIGPRWSRFPELDDSQTEPRELTDLADTEHLGVRSGSGFCDYPDGAEKLRQRITGASG
jgi:3-hydroxyacyl-CoA dehydrogenase